MQTGSRTARRHRAKMLLAGLCLLLAGSALAQRVEGDRVAAQDAYQAEVAVRTQTDADREKAYARGLAQVLAKLTGDRDIAQRAGVREELKDADTYVTGFDYRQDESVGPTGAPSFQTTLVLRFQQQAVDDLIALLGLPSWPQPHPKPVLWLAIDDGSGPRLVALAQANAARSILEQAKARDFSLGLPAGSTAELAAVGAIWRGDTAAITALSKRYSPPMQLIGKLQRSAGGWRADWTFVDHGKVLASWQSTNIDARQAMADGADGAADALFKRYAKVPAGSVPGTYRVKILGIHASSDYLRLASYLQTLPGVRRVAPVTASPELLELRLELAGGLANFGRFVDRGGVLASVSDGPEATANAAASGAGGAPVAPSTFRLRGG